jgi:hypothetical protein
VNEKAIARAGLQGRGKKNMRDEVKGESRQLHNEELHDLYYSPTIVRVMK